VRSAVELRRVRAELREHYDLLKKQRDDLMRLQLQKERLMAFVVHDLKNPVHAMDLHAQLLLHEELPADARESVLQIRAGARRLTQMILNLLDVSKADEGRLVAQRSDVDLVGADRRGARGGRGAGRGPQRQAAERCRRAASARRPRPAAAHPDEPRRERDPLRAGGNDRDGLVGPDGRRDAAPRRRRGARDPRRAARPDLRPVRPGRARRAGRVAVEPRPRPQLLQDGRPGARRRDLGRGCGPRRGVSA
jgi:hypothetical protein